MRVAPERRDESGEACALQRKRLPGFCPSVEPHDRGRLLSDQTAPRASVGGGRFQLDHAEPGTLAVFKAGGVRSTAPLWGLGLAKSVPTGRNDHDASGARSALVSRKSTLSADVQMFELFGSAVNCCFESRASDRSCRGASTLAIP